MQQHEVSRARPPAPVRCGKSTSLADASTAGSQARHVLKPTRDTATEANLCSCTTLGNHSKHNKSKNNNNNNSSVCLPSDRLSWCSGSCSTLAPSSTSSTHRSGSSCSSRAGLAYGKKSNCTSSPAHVANYSAEQQVKKRASEEIASKCDSPLAASMPNSRMTRGSARSTISTQLSSIWARLARVNNGPHDSNSNSSSRRGTQQQQRAQLKTRQLCSSSVVQEHAFQASPPPQHMPPCSAGSKMSRMSKLKRSKTIAALKFGLTFGALRSSESNTSCASHCSKSTNCTNTSGSKTLPMSKNGYLSGDTLTSCTVHSAAASTCSSLGPSPCSRSGESNTPLHVTFARACPVPSGKAAIRANKRLNSPQISQNGLPHAQPRNHMLPSGKVHVMTHSESHQKQMDQGESLNGLIAPTGDLGITTGFVSNARSKPNAAAERRSEGPDGEATGAGAGINSRLSLGMLLFHSRLHKSHSMLDHTSKQTCITSTSKASCKPADSPQQVCATAGTRLSKQRHHQSMSNFTCPTGVRACDTVRGQHCALSGSCSAVSGAKSIIRRRQSSQQQLTGKEQARLQAAAAHHTRTINPNNPINAINAINSIDSNRHKAHDLISKRLSLPADLNIPEQLLEAAIRQDHLRRLRLPPTFLGANTSIPSANTLARAESVAAEQSPLFLNLLLDTNQPLTRSQRRLSLMELGFGKKETYVKLEELGQGTYATVYKGRSTLARQLVALKQIRLEHEEGAPCTAIREISLLKGLKHNNIVTLHDIVYTSQSLTLVFEFVDMDLSKYMAKCNNMLHVDNVRIFMFQMLRGLNFIHSQKILHRDLKPQNLLITEQGVLKIADFGLARAKTLPIKTFSNEVVTLWYRPPDVLKGSTDYNSAIDMWGVACIFFEMATGSPLFAGWKADSQLAMIDKTFGPKPNELTMLPFEISSKMTRFRPDAFDLMFQLMRYDPQRRISAQAAMRHKYFDRLHRRVHTLDGTVSIFTLPDIRLQENPIRPTASVTNSPPPSDSSNGTKAQGPSLVDKCSSATGVRISAQTHERKQKAKIARSVSHGPLDLAAGLGSDALSHKPRTLAAPPIRSVSGGKKSHMFWWARGKSKSTFSIARSLRLDSSALSEQHDRPESRGQWSSHQSPGPLPVGDERKVAVGDGRKRLLLRSLSVTNVANLFRLRHSTPRDKVMSLDSLEADSGVDGLDGAAPKSGEHERLPERHSIGSSLTACSSADEPVTPSEPSPSKPTVTSNSRYKSTSFRLLLASSLHRLHKSRSASHLEHGGPRAQLALATSDSGGGVGTSDTSPHTGALGSHQCSTGSQFCLCSGPAGLASQSHSSKQMTTRPPPPLYLSSL